MEYGKFDKTKVKITEPVPSEKGWEFVEYNKTTVGQIYFSGSYQKVKSFHARENLFGIKGKTKQELAEKLCKHVIGEIKRDYIRCETFLEILIGKQE